MKPGKDGKFYCSFTSHCDLGLRKFVAPTTITSKRAEDSFRKEIVVYMPQPTRLKTTYATAKHSD